MHERRARSLAKTLTWRLVATTDTFLLALIFTGNPLTALSIGGLEVFTKMLWYYLHERAWLFVGRPKKVPQSLSSELAYGGHARSVLKAITWRVVGTLDTFLLSLLITGRAIASGSIGGTELLTKSLLYYLHERLWLHVHWGLPQEAHVPPASRIEHLVRTLRHYYHMSAAIFYGFMTVLTLVAGALLIYAAHTYL